MTLYYYFVTIKHEGNRKLRVKTVAEDEPTAKDKVCQFECCLPSVIVKCKKIKALR